MKKDGFHLNPAIYNGHKRADTPLELLHAAGPANAGASSNQPPTGDPTGGLVPLELTGKTLAPANGNGNGKASKAHSNGARHPRWSGIERPYTAADVERLRGSVRIEHSLARMGAERLWTLLHTEPYVQALGAVSGNQAIEQVQAGLKAIYVSGWQVAADANTSGEMYPDQSLYPADSAPSLVRKINKALQRADQIDHAEGRTGTQWFAPLIADAEAGFGGPLNAFELMKSMIEAGAAAVHFEDQLSSVKKCGHMGGKVLVPTGEFISKLVAARLAADVMGVPAILIARTDANSAGLIRSDFDARDHQFMDGRRTPEGDFLFWGGISAAIARGLAYAPYADILWCETTSPDLDEARRFAEAIHEEFPAKLLAYNCSSSFNWRKKLDADTLPRFQQELAAMGYKFQFVTLAGFHALNMTMFELARAYRQSGMAAYSEMQENEFKLEADSGYRAIKHQRFVGAGYFDDVTQVIAGGSSSVTALQGSTEEAQFTGTEPAKPAGEAPAAPPAAVQPPRPERTM